MTDNKRLRNLLTGAVKHFWKTRKFQSAKQGKDTGQKDAGNRSAVTGGAQMNGFINCIRGLLEESGIERPLIFCDRAIELPGWFRPEKKWDLLVVADGKLLACIEFKSHVGSFGNNFNNRTEEALGSATDILAAYREGAFSPSNRPWLGYLMHLEEAPGSTRSVRAREPHFKVFPEFKNASYLMRYEILLKKLLRERLYDGVCLITSNMKTGIRGEFREPDPEIDFRSFITPLLAHAIASRRLH